MVITKPVLGKLTAANFATIVQQDAELKDFDPRTFLPRLVVKKPEKYLPLMIAYWQNHQPDLSEGRPFKPDDLMFWKSICKGLTAHKTFPG